MFRGTMKVIVFPLREGNEVPIEDALDDDRRLTEWFSVRIVAVGLACLSLSVTAIIDVRAADRNLSGEIQAFAEPYRTIDVAAVEAGLVTIVLVEEGDSVEKHDRLAELHQDVQKAALDVSRAQRDSTGVLTGAEAELRLRESIWKKFKELRRADHASDEEARRSESEYEIAQSRVLQAREQLLIKKLECERSELQLAQRTIRSPIAGIVTQVHKDAGEFLSPSDPIVVTIVQLDPLTVSFSVPVGIVNGLSQGQKVPLRIDGLKQPRNAEVELVSSLINAESQTVPCVPIMSETV